MLKMLEHNFFRMLISIVLFMVLIPGMIITLPSAGSNKIVTALVHAIVFYFVCSILKKMLLPHPKTQNKKSKK